MSGEDGKGETEKTERREGFGCLAVAIAVLSAFAIGVAVGAMVFGT